MHLFTKKEAASIPCYKYDGGDRSLLYKFVLSPLAASLTELLPVVLHIPADIFTYSPCD